MGLVYGYRAYPAIAQIYRHPFTGAAIATPVLDLFSTRGPQGYVDQTGNGNWGVPVGDPLNARGVLDEAIKFDGVDSTLNCGSNASLDIAADISGLAWVDGTTAAAQAILAKTNSAAAGWNFIGTAGNLAQAYFYSGGASVASAVAIRNGLRHVGFTVQSNVCRVFVDGLESGRGAVVMSDSAADSLYVGSVRGAANYWSGKIELPRVYSGALSPEQIYRKYLEASAVPIFNDDFSGYGVSLVACSAGSMCGPFRIVTNAAAIAPYADGNKYAIGASGGGLYTGQILPLPEPFTYGTIEFTFWRTNYAAYDFSVLLLDSTYPASFTAWQFVFASGAGGGNFTVYRYLFGGLAAAYCGGAMTPALAAGVPYQFRIVRRNGGTTSFYIKGGAYPDWATVGSTNALPFTDNAITSMPSFYLYSNLSDGLTKLRVSRVCELPESFPWIFTVNYSYVSVISGSTVWASCAIASVLQIPKDLDWQTCILGLYKGADANVTDVLFLASEIGSTVAANQNGYAVRLAADESVQLIRTSAGVETQVATTAAAYVALATEYTIKIVRNASTNAYSFYIMGGAYADWTLMFAATLGIYTSSNYMCWDLDVADRATAPAFDRDMQ